MSSFLVCLTCSSWEVYLWCRFPLQNNELFTTWSEPKSYIVWFTACCIAQWINSLNNRLYCNCMKTMINRKLQWDRPLRTMGLGFRFILEILISPHFNNSTCISKLISLNTHYLKVMFIANPLHSRKTSRLRNCFVWSENIWTLLISFR